MSHITIEKLYTNYDILAQAKNIEEHVKEYEEIIAGVRGGEKEKKLASQFIAKYFKYFPTLQYDAIDAIFDTCEDDDMSIRKQAMKVLPSLCKDTKEYTGKVADVLAQLLQLDDPQENAIASNALIEIIKNEPVSALNGIFKQINAGEYIVREKCIKFIATKIPTLGSDVITKEIEDVIVAELKKMIVDTSGPEFIALMEYLMTTRYGKTPLGEQELIDFAAEQIDFSSEFDPNDKDNDVVDRLILCVQLVMPFFPRNHDPAKFVEYICDKVLPHADNVGNIEGEVISESIKRGELLQLKIFKQLAELTTYCGQLKNPTKQVQNIFERLKAYLPLPPEDTNVTAVPFQDYSVVECLMYAFHRLARQCPEFLTSNPNILKDFRSRLQYFSRGVQGCIKTLKENADLKKDDDKRNTASYVITTNINTLIKDLFYTPPTYKSVITLSWKIKETPKKTAETKVTPGKRHAPITFDPTGTPNKLNRKSTDNVKIYTPPSGKFSNNFQNSNRKPMRGRARGSGRGRGRGRGGWRH